MVYADESIMYGAKSLVSVICDRTDMLSSSQEDLEVLGDGQPPTEEVNLSVKHNSNQLYIWATVAVTIGIVVFFILYKRKRLD